MRTLWIAVLLLVAAAGDDDKKVDPTKYKFPSQAKAAESKHETPGRARGGDRAYLGVSGSNSDEEKGALLSTVRRSGPAAKGGLKSGDRVLEMDDEEVKNYRHLIKLLRDKKADEKVEFLVIRDDEEIELTVKLGRRRSGGGPQIWKKPVFRLAIVLFEFQDVRHHPDFKLEDFHNLLFSRNSYTRRDSAGMRVYGSLADYYWDQSYGKVRVKGKVFDWVALDEERAYFEEKRMGDRRASRKLMPRAIELVREREGNPVQPTVRVRRDLRYCEGKDAILEKGISTLHKLLTWY